MNTRFTRVTIMVAVVLLAACAQQPPQPAAPPDTRAQDEAAIRAVVKEWSASASSKDPTKFTSFYNEDAVFMLEGAPLASGKTAIAEALGPMMQDPNFALTFQTTKAEVARSGDIAYETGTYQITTSDPRTKKPVTGKGKYVVVWKKVGGTWKAAVDAPVLNPPEAPPATSKSKK